MPRRPPPPISAEAEALYVKLPFSPEVVRAIQGHASAAMNVVKLIGDAQSSLSELVLACTRAAAELERDIQRVRAVEARRPRARARKR